MPYDGITAECIARELDNILVGGRIEKVYQPEKDIILLAIRAGGKNHRVCLNASARMPGIFMTDRSFSNPDNAPLFCMVLRKHIQTGKIINVSALNSERVITIFVEAIDELGDKCVKKLIAEIMGKHSNIILVSRNGRIIDAIKHIDSDISNVREVMPGRCYIDPPSQNKIGLTEFIKNTSLNELVNTDATPIADVLLSNIKGFSPQLCREVCLRAGINPKTSVSDLGASEIEKLSLVLSRVSADIIENKYTPCIVYGQDGKARDFHCLSMEKSAPGSIKYFNSANQAADIFYSERAFSDYINQKKTNLRNTVLRKIEKLEKKLDLLKNDIRNAEGMDIFRLYGELITANIYRLKQGMEHVTVENYKSSDVEMVEIPMEPKLSPQANAQIYFKRYSKSRNTIKIAGEKASETEKEIEYLENILYDIDESSNEKELDNVIKELESEGFISKGQDSGKNGKKKKSSKQPDNQGGRELYVSTDGYRIIAGKNNIQNDRLTLKESAASDLWLHARNIPGAHVVVKRIHGKDIPERTIYEAAVIAAWNSRSKFSSSVPVDITEIRNVRKPAGGRPGMVIYNKFSTLVVKPDRELAEKLIVKEKGE